MTSTIDRPARCGAGPRRIHASASSTSTTDPAADGGPPDDPFGRLVRLVRDNDRLIAELDALGTRIAEARAYGRRPDAHSLLAGARITQLRDRRSGVLARLRANRAVARAILGRPLPGDA